MCWVRKTYVCFGKCLQRGKFSLCEGVKVELVMDLLSKGEDKIKTEAHPLFTIYYLNR
jgi:hypothetical protein